MTIAIDNHIFPETEASNSEGESSEMAVPPLASGNEPTLPAPPATSASASSLSFLLNADNVEVDSQLSLRNRLSPSSDTPGITDNQLS
jgi:hypothetical protein